MEEMWDVRNTLATGAASNPENRAHKAELSL